MPETRPNYTWLKVEAEDDTGGEVTVYVIVPEGASIMDVAARKLTPLCQTDNEANADFIIAAVNAHRLH